MPMSGKPPEIDDIERFKSEIPPEFREETDDEDPEGPAQTGFTFAERLQWAFLLGAGAFILTLLGTAATGMPLASVFIASAFVGVAVGVVVLLPGVLLALQVILFSLMGSQ